MKKYAIVFVMSFVSCLLVGQEKNAPSQVVQSTAEGNTQKREDDNQLNGILIESLRSCLKHYSDLKGYICKDGLPADFPFDSIQDVTFFSLWNISGLSTSLQKDLSKGKWSYFVSIELQGRKINITIERNHVTLIKKFLRKRQIYIDISDWGIFTYEYSYEKQKWLLIKTEYGGI